MKFHPTQKSMFYSVCTRLLNSAVSLRPISWVSYHPLPLSQLLPFKVTTVVSHKQIISGSNKRNSDSRMLTSPCKALRFKGTYLVDKCSFGYFSVCTHFTEDMKHAIRANWRSKFKLCPFASKCLAHLLVRFKFLITIYH